MIQTVFAHDGISVFTGTWTAITAARGFNSNLLKIPEGATHFVRYNTGGVTALVVGEVLTGGTSNKTCKLIAQAVENGTAGAGDSGIIFVASPSGAFVAETLTGAAGGTVAIQQALIPLIASSPYPKACLIVVETAAINCTVGGVLPTLAAGTNDGVNMSAGTSRVIRGVENIRSFKAINAANANGAILKYELLF